MVTVNDVTQMMFRWAPPELAMDWDNVGLLVGRGDREVHRVLVALDVSPDVAAEAAETGTDLIVSHHPVMNIRWHAQQMQTLREDTRLGGLLTELVKRDISAMCMHTNLDAAEGGVNERRRPARSQGGRGRRSVWGIHPSGHRSGLRHLCDIRPAVQ